VVVGGGFIGLEMAENFRELGLEVHLIELAQQVMAPVDYPIAAMVQQHLRQHGVHLHLGVSVGSFSEGPEGLTVHLSDGSSLPAGMVLLSIGVRPDTRLAVQAGLNTGKARGIEVNAFLQTSDPDIYAAGDAIEFANPISGQPLITYLAGPANKQGRIAADNMVLGNVEAYKGSINTAIVKVFGITVATAGMAAKHLEAAGIPHQVSITHSGSHAGYYPGARHLTLQLAFDPASGRILGAQALGAEGVDKRIDVLALLIRQGGTIADLTEFEHAYAPPYSSAKDPVNMAGFVAENILHQRLRIYHSPQLDRLPADALLIDVRRPDEYEAGRIPGALNLPLDELRSRLDTLPREQPLFLYCEAGLRGYLAQRILVQHGFGQVSNLSGGYYLWKHLDAERQALQNAAIPA
jgi:rhodanese-related sulfurtransferase